MTPASVGWCRVSVGLVQGLNGARVGWCRVSPPRTYSARVCVRAPAPVPARVCVMRTLHTLHTLHGALVTLHPHPTRTLHQPYTSLHYRILFDAFVSERNKEERE